MTNPDPTQKAGADSSSNPGQPSSTPANCMDDYDPDSLSMDAATQLIQQRLRCIEGSEILPLSLAFGRVLANTVNSAIDVPGFRNSAMDGFAFRHAEAIESAQLRVAGSSLAGHAWQGTLRKNECVRVMTGAYLPPAADTVVMQENTSLDKDLVSIERLPDAGTNIREAGSNIKANSPLLQQYDYLGAIELGLLASAGIHEVEVLRKLKVACFSTGDELALPGTPLETGMIHDSNRIMLLGLLQQPSIDRIDLGICQDSLEAVKKVMQQCAGADVAISSGGVSVGEADFIKLALGDSGNINFWKIAMKPGRPLTHAVLDSGTHFFGLPGNPVSGAVTFQQFVLPAIETLQGQIPRSQYTIQAKLESGLTKQAGRTELQRGNLAQNEDGSWSVSTTGAQDSHVLSSMHRANCYIVLNSDSTGAKSGEWVVTLPFTNYWQRS